MASTQDPRIGRIEGLIGAHPDFPKKGILFRDVFPVMRNPEVFGECIDVLCERIVSKCGNIDVIVGLDARGFIFGPLMAQKLKCAFVPIRKAGKLPGACAQVEYTLEYGKDVFEAQKDSITAGQKVVIMDDLLATGGTMSAACQLVKSLNAEILECMVVIEMTALKGRDKVPSPVFSLIQYHDD